MSQNFLLAVVAMRLTAHCAFAAPLTGSGTALALPMAPNTGALAPGIAPTVPYPGNSSATNSFTGVFSAPAHSNWLGSFQGSGQYPCCSNQSVSSWDFSGLAPGHLPAGTFMRLGDVDQLENFKLTAFDANSAVIQVLRAVPGVQFAHVHLREWNLWVQGRQRQYAFDHFAADQHKYLPAGGEQ